MENFFIPEDIPVICVQADSFPDGVMKAHEKLHTLIPFIFERRIFGISWGGENGSIQYQAAAEILKTDENILTETFSFIIRQGKYMSILITDFMKDSRRIGQAFEELLKISNLDPEGYCLEWYIGNGDVRCLVPVIEG